MKPMHGNLMGMNSNVPIKGEFKVPMENGMKIFTRTVSCPHNDIINLQVILVHPFPFSSEIYSGFYESSLVKEFLEMECNKGNHVRFLFPDLPGFGQTLPITANPKDLGGYVDIIHALAENLPLVIGGCSMGGYVALEYVSHYETEGLILIDTHPYEDPLEKRDARIRQAGQFEKVLKSGLGLNNADLRILSLKMPMFAEFLHNLRKQLVTESNSEIGMKALELMQKQSLVGIISALRAMAGRKSNVNTLKEYEKPVLIVVGEKDKITPVEMAQKMSELNSNHSTMKIITDSGHLPMLEKVQDFNKTIIDWLEKVLENMVK